MAALLVLGTILVLPQPWPQLFEPAPGAVPILLLVAVVALILALAPRRLLAGLMGADVGIALYALAALLSLWLSFPKRLDPAIVDNRMQASALTIAVFVLSAGAVVAWAMAVSGAPLRDWRRWLRALASRPAGRLD